MAYVAPVPHPLLLPAFPCPFDPFALAPLAAGLAPLAAPFWPYCGDDGLNAGEAGLDISFALPERRETYL